MSTAGVESGPHQPFYQDAILRFLPPLCDYGFMPHQRTDPLPDAVRKALPSEAGRSLFRAAFKSAKARGESDEVAFISGWYALSKAGFQQNQATGCWQQVEKAQVPCLPGTAQSLALLNAALDRISGGAGRALTQNDDGTAGIPFPYAPGILGTLEEDQIPRFYAALTDAGSLPVVKLPLASLNAMQNRVDPAKVSGIRQSGKGSPPIVVRLRDGAYYIADGHHRAVAAWLDGAEEIECRFKDLQPVTNALKASPDGHVPPKAVQENARRALEVRESKPESQRGMTAVGIARARDLSNGKAVSLETVRRMKAYFDRHQQDKQGSTWDEQGKGWQAWMGWGGDEGWKWARGILEAKIATAAKSFSVVADVVKSDDDQQVVYGWASIVEVNGSPVIDSEGDVISIEDLEQAALAYVEQSRMASVNHTGLNVGTLIESIVFTKEKQASLGIDLGKVGWWVGFRINDPAIWQRVKSGELKAFSIGGRATPVEEEISV